MSNNPQAKFEIVADDKTKAAFTSALNSINEFHHKFEGLMNTAIAGFTLNKVVENIHQAVELGDQMEHAAEKSGIAVEQFSALSYAAKQLGDIDLPTLSKGIKEMQIDIASGGANIKKLGIDFETFKRLSPEQQFEMIAEAISKIEDPAIRTARSVDIFKKAGNDLIPVFAEGADGIHRYVEEAKRLGIVLSKDQAEALQQADESVKRLDASWQALWKTMAVGTVRISQALGLMDKGPKERFADLVQYQQNLKLMIDGINNQQGQQSWWKRAFGGYDPTMLPELQRQLKSVEDEMAKLQDQAKNGSKDQGAPDGIDESAIDDIVKAEAKQNALLRKITDERTRATMEQFKQLGEWFDAHVNALDAADKATRASAEKRAAIEDKFFTDIDLLVRNHEITQEDAQARITEYWDNSHKMMSTTTKQTMEDMSEYAKEAAHGIQNSLEQFFYDPAKDGLKGLLSNFVDTFRKIISEIAAQKAALALFGEFDKKGNSSGGYLSDFINGLFSGFGGGKAVGGSVSSGTPYLVGERGPELFVPRANGTIIPNHALAGGGAVTYSQTNIFNSGTDNQLRQQLPSLLKQTHDQAVSTIVEMKRRNRF